MKPDKFTNPKSFLQKTKEMPVNREFLVSLKKSLLLHIKMNPPEEVIKPPFTPVPSRYLLTPVFAAAVIILVVGCTSFATQSSLPGDVLYPVKILSEKVSVAATFSPEARSRVRLSIASERVNEATKLAEINQAEPKLNDEQFHAAMQTIITNFNEQVSSNLAEGNELLEKDDAEGSLKIANDTEAATDSYKKILFQAKNRGRHKDSEDVDQLINSNEGFNARAESQSVNSESAKEKSSNKSDDKRKNRRQRDERERNEKETRNEKNENSSLVIPSSFVPASVESALTGLMNDASEDPRSDIETTGGDQNSVIPEDSEHKDGNDDINSPEMDKKIGDKMDLHPDDRITVPDNSLSIPEDAQKNGDDKIDSSKKVKKADGDRDSTKRREEREIKEKETKEREVKKGRDRTGR